jgi:hypothetical protein
MNIKQNNNLIFPEITKTYQVSIKRRWIIISYCVDPAKYHVMIAVRLSNHAPDILPCSTFVEPGTYIRMQRKKGYLRI